MKLRATVISLALLLAIGAGCTKPSTSNGPTTDNSTQGQDNAGRQSGAANSQQTAEAEQPRVPEVITIPSGKVLTIRLSDAVGSKISQPGQSFGGSLARAVELNGETVVPAGA